MNNLDRFIRLLEDSLNDLRLDDGEKRMIQAEMLNGILSDEDCAFLRNQSFRLAQQHVEKGEDVAAILRWLERVVRLIDNTKTKKIAATASSWFSPGRACVSGIREQLRRAQTSIDICVFTIADDELTEEVLLAYKRGVNIRIISDNHKANDLGSDIDYLVKKGLDIKLDTTNYHMHHKFAIFDGVRLINGSFNWTKSASRNNQEDITLTDDIRFVNAFKKQFEHLWKKFPSYVNASQGVMS